MCTGNVKLNPLLNVMDGVYSISISMYGTCNILIFNASTCRATTTISVACMAKKNPRVLAKKTQMYLWTLFTVAIFYALPVVQLVFTYQNVC